MSQAMIDRQQGIADLDVLFAALRTDPTKPVAMTAAADSELHRRLGTPELAAFVRINFGEGAVLDHNADAWGTDEFRDAWRRTRDAAWPEGVILAEDPATQTNDGRQAAVCFVFIKYQH